MWMGAPSGTLGLAGTGGVLPKEKGEVLISFFKSIGVKDSNEEGVLAILEALGSYPDSF